MTKTKRRKRAYNRHMLKRIAYRIIFALLSYGLDLSLAHDTRVPR